MAHYVISDIHGFFDRYIKCLEQINLQKDDTLFVLGDVIDRGPDGIKILQDMMSRKNVVPIIGNHELMMLDFLYGYDKNEIWLHDKNGGKQTLKQFIELDEKERKKIVKYIKSFYIQKEVTINEVDFMLCHAFYDARFKDLKFMENQDIADSVVWFSPFRKDKLYVPSKYYKLDHLFIVGHVPVQTINEEAPYIYRNIIDIDGGCAISPSFEQYGYLCCVKLDDLVCDCENPFVLRIR